jgi:hypothetical protein
LRWKEEEDTKSTESPAEEAETAEATKAEEAAAEATEEEEALTAAVTEAEVGISNKDLEFTRAASLEPRSN